MFPEKSISNYDNNAAGNAGEEGGGQGSPVKFPYSREHARFSSLPIMVASLIRHNYTASAANNPAFRLVSLKIAARQIHRLRGGEVSRSNFSTCLCARWAAPGLVRQAQGEERGGEGRKRANRRRGSEVCASRSLIRLGQISTQMQTHVAKSGGRGQAAALCPSRPLLLRPCNDLSGGTFCVFRD